MATTLEIQENFPELYMHLDETPVSASSVNKEIDLNDFENYFNTIQALLKEKIRNEKNQLSAYNSKPIKSA